MVMSQAAIDSLMAEVPADPGQAVQHDIDALVTPEAQAPTAEVEAPGAPAPAGAAGDGLSDEERAIIAEAAGAAGEPQEQGEAPQQVQSAPDEAGPKVRTWSASATPQGDQIEARIQELELKINTLESAPPPAAAAAPTADDSAAVANAAEIGELKTSLAQVSDMVQTIWTALHDLTRNSQDSLGYAAKQIFDCPECGNHGTVAVPVSCTNCGYEGEWGFWPDQEAS